MKRKALKRKAGRPKAIIDWDKVSYYLKSQCNATGIASIMGITVDTLYNRCKVDNKLDFSVYCQQKKDEGKELLRANQFKIAMQGNVPMNIWLGKQYLDQKDKTETEHSGSIDVIKLTAVEREKRILELSKKLNDKR